MADAACRSARSKLVTFRITELKDALARLGLPKQGKKQVLVDRIMELINPAERQQLSRGSRKKGVSREEAIAIIDEQYRKLRSVGYECIKRKAAKSGSSSGYPSAAPSEHVREETKTRCSCGNNVDTGTMIQCDDLTCRVWQHMSCVVIPEEPANGVQAEIPPNHYCELCRINRSDPFCVPVTQLLMPTKLRSAAKSDGANTLQNIEQAFYLSRPDRELLQKPEYDLQVWCVLLSDKVSFRIHWPSYADLRVNGVNVRVTNRPGQQLLGLNGRDEGPGITVCTREGLNRLNMSAYDARPFRLGVRIIQRLSLEQVMDLIPSEDEGEPLSEAMARVRRCINGGGGQGRGGGDDNDGSDSDLEVVAESISVNLRCPMSGSRIKVAGRFKPCLHMACFDLNTFVELNQRARKWQCPTCLKNYAIEHLIIDPFFNRITNAVRALDEDVTEVELKADGSWRPKMEGSARKGEPWRPSPGSAATNDTPAPVLLEEGRVSSHEGDGVQNGTLRLNTLTLTKSSSATESNLKDDVDELSVNQDQSEKTVVCIDDEANVEAEFSSRPGGTCGDDPANGASVIVLSDSDDEAAEEEETEAVIGSSGASAHAESPEVTIPDDIAAEILAAAIAREAIRLAFDPLLVSTRVGVGVPDRSNNNNSSGLGLQVDSNSFWTAPAAVSQRASLVQATAPVPAVSGNGFLSTSLVEEESLQPGWRSFSPASPSVPDGGSVDSEATASPLQNFLPAQPARAAEVEKISRGTSLPEGDINDSWFSLSVGGGEESVEPTSARSLRTSSPRIAGVDTNSRGLGSHGSSQRLMDSRPPVRSRVTADGHPFPVRPRSSAVHARRVYRQLPMDDGSDNYCRYFFPYFFPSPFFLVPFPSKGEFIPTCCCAFHAAIQTGRSSPGDAGVFFSARNSSNFALNFRTSGAEEEEEEEEEDVEAKHKHRDKHEREHEEEEEERKKSRLCTNSPSFCCATEFRTASDAEEEDVEAKHKHRDKHEHEHEEGEGERSRDCM